MSAKESLQEMIKKTRSKVETRFASFENAIQQDLSAATTLTASLRAEIQDEKFPAPDSKKIEEENLRLRKQAQDHQAQIQALESASKNLRESLKVMASERQELANQIQVLEERLAQDASRQDSELNERAGTESENTLLKEKMERILKRRVKSALLWKRRANVLRNLRKTQKDSSPREQELSSQVEKLTAELDSSLELVAELRDELHWNTRFNPPGLKS